jgi:uncharacterized RDD family membrane protein YckC
MIEQHPLRPYASFLRRTLSYLIDMLVCVLLLIPFWIWFFRGLFSPESGSYLIGYALLIPPVWLLLQGIYFTTLWHLKEASIGCMVMHLRVVRSDTSTLSIISALLRYIGMTGEALILGAGMAAMFFNPRRQSLHDTLSDTIVLDVS